MRLRSLTLGVALTLAALLVIPGAPANAAPVAKPTVRAGVVNPAAWGIQIRNANSGLCLAARAGSGERPVIQTTCDYTVGAYWPDQYWLLLDVDQDSHNHRIYSTYLGLCIAARGSGEVGAVATTCGSGSAWPDQIWHFEFVPRWQADRFQNRNSGNCLAARGSGESRAIATTCNYVYPDQHWF
jgi:hypothetical protein